MIIRPKQSYFQLHAEIDGNEVAVSKALQAMERLAVFRGPWSALNHIYFASDDSDGVIESLYERISEEWLKNE